MLGPLRKRNDLMLVCYKNGTTQCKSVTKTEQSVSKAVSSQPAASNNRRGSKRVTLVPALAPKTPGMKNPANNHCHPGLRGLTYMYARYWLEYRTTRWIPRCRAVAEIVSSRRA